MRCIPGPEVTVFQGGMVNISWKRLLFGRKAMTNLDSILKTRDITLPTKVYIVKAMVFPVVMYGCEIWTIRKVEHWRRIDAFELWCWRRLLRVPWTAKRSNQSIIKEINTEYSLEGLKLKLQYFGHLMWRANSLEKTLRLGKIEDKRRRGRQRMRWLDSITDSMDMRDREAWHAAVHGVAKSWTWLSNWNNNSEKDKETGIVLCQYYRVAELLERTAAFDYGMFMISWGTSCELSFFHFELLNQAVKKIGKRALLIIWGFMCRCLERWDDLSCLKGGKK